MKIAITGGAGFIGTRLAGILLSQGHEIRLLDIRPSDLYPEHSFIADVRDKAALEKHCEGIDIIYHLAAEHRDDVSPAQLYYDVNVGGAENVIAIAKTHTVNTIIFSSSVALYGLDSGDSRETDTPKPFNDYGRSKWESEELFERWAKEEPGRTLVTIRLVATFGPGNRGNIYNLIQQIAKNKFIMIGRGHNRKSIAYVGNVAAFLVHCLTLPPGYRLFNYADKPDLTMKDLVASVRTAMGMQGTGFRLPYAAGLIGGFAFDIAARLTGRTFPISAIRVKKFCADTVVNAEKAAAGFTPPYSLGQGLEEMIAAEFPDRYIKKGRS